MISAFGIEHGLVSKAKSRVARALFQEGKISSKPEKTHYITRREREGQILTAHYEGRANAKAVARGEKSPSDVNYKRYTGTVLSDQTGPVKIPLHPKKAFLGHGKLGQKDGSKSRMWALTRKRKNYIYWNHPELVPEPKVRLSGREMASPHKKIVGLP